MATKAQGTRPCIHQQVVGDDDTILFAIRTHRYRFMVQPSGTLETTYMNATYIISTWNLTDWDYTMPRKSRNEVSMLSMESRRTQSGNRCSAPQVVSMAQDSPSVGSNDMQNVNLNLHSPQIHYDDNSIWIGFLEWKNAQWLKSGMFPVPINKFNCDRMNRATEFLPKNRVVWPITAVCRQKVYTWSTWNKSVTCKKQSSLSRNCPKNTQFQRTVSQLNELYWNINNQLLFTIQTKICITQIY